MTQAKLVDLTAQIVANYVTYNRIVADQIPALVASTHAALTRASMPVSEPAAAPRVPAVPIRKSVTDEYIVSLETGEKFKTLTRHLSGRGMTPDAYRAKWGLDADYPMIAPAYARKRSEIATATGLGQVRRGKSSKAAKAGKAARARKKG